MDQEQTGQEIPIPDRLPQRISEGMMVYDREGEVVGTVQVVYLGGASEEAIKKALKSHEASDVTTGESDESDFDANEVPLELRRRLMEKGYVLIQGPDLTGAKRYLTPEQIEGVFSEEVDGVFTDVVRLRITRGELLNA
jgi:hypothetical protein